MLGRRDEVITLQGQVDRINYANVIQFFQGVDKTPRNMSESIRLMIYAIESVATQQEWFEPVTSIEEANYILEHIIGAKFSSKNLWIEEEF